MPLTRADHAALLLELQMSLREADPELYSLVARHVEVRDDPRSALLAYLEVLAEHMSERSSGAHGRILNSINRHIRTESGAALRGIRVELSPTEREVMQREHVDLAVLPDRSKVVDRIRQLHEAIESDGEKGQTRGRDK